MLRPANVFAGLGIDFDLGPLINKKRDAQLKAGLTNCDFDRIRNRIPANPGRRLGHLEDHDPRQLRKDGLFFIEIDLDLHTFFQLVFFISQDLFGQREGLIILHVHKMIPLNILVQELALLRIQSDPFKRRVGREPGLNNAAVLEIFHGDLKKGPQVTGRTMSGLSYEVHFILVKNDGPFFGVSCLHGISSRYDQVCIA